MSGLPIISADERLAERRGIKGCIFGKSGIGKTSLLWTLEPEATLFLDLGVALPDGVTARMISTGGAYDGAHYHSTVMLGSDGRVYSCGNYGQYGAWGIGQTATQRRVRWSFSTIHSGIRSSCSRPHRTRACPNARLPACVEDVDCRRAAGYS